MLFEIEMRYESFVVLTIEADDRDAAMLQAWTEVDARKPGGGWDVESIEVIEGAI